MTTFGIRASAVKAACRSPAREEISAKVLPCISLMSAPAAKTFGPPQSTTAPTRSSPLTIPAASRSSSWTCSLRAFTGGRSSFMVATRSSTSTDTNSTRSSSVHVGGARSPPRPPRAPVQWFRWRGTTRSRAPGLYWGEATGPTGRCCRRTPPLRRAREGRGGRRPPAERPARRRRLAPPPRAAPPRAGAWPPRSPRPAPAARRPRHGRRRQARWRSRGGRRGPERLWLDLDHRRAPHASTDPFGRLLHVRPGDHGSEAWWFGVFTPDVFEGVDHLALGGLGPGRLDQQRDQVLVGGGGALQPVQGGLDAGVVAGGATAGQLGTLLAFDLLGDAQDLQLLVLVGDVLVDPHDHLGALLQRLLVGKRRIRHLLLEPALLDAGQDPVQHRSLTQPVDGPQQVLRALLLEVGHLLHVPGAAQWVDGCGHAGLLGQYLLGPQRGRGGPLGRQREHLVQRVGVQALGATQHGGQRLHRGLGVELQLLRLRILDLVAVPQPPGPDPPGRAELADLLEEIDVRVEEERQLLGHHAKVQAAALGQLQVGEPIGQGEP